MEIIKAATKWTKAEMVSALFFMGFGIVYLSIAIYFWQFGEREFTKALFIPMLISGGLLLSAGLSFYLSSRSLLKRFESEYKADPNTLIQSEIVRAEKTIKSYENVALKFFPLVLVVAILLYIVISSTLIKAICIGIIVFLSAIILLDSQALKRMKTYYQELKLEEKELSN